MSSSVCSLDDQLRRARLKACTSLDGNPHHTRVAQIKEFPPIRSPKRSPPARRRNLPIKLWVGIKATGNSNRLQQVTLRGTGSARSDQFGLCWGSLQETPTRCNVANASYRHGTPLSVITQGPQFDAVKDRLRFADDR